MKVLSWQDIIVSWANALRLVDQPVKDVLDLVKGSFFIKLLNKTKNVERSGDTSFSEDDLYNVIENFLKVEFSGFRLLGYWDSDEVTLVASVFLLWSSLESQSCRTPLYQLDDSVQIKIQTFIQRFIETPQHLINRQLVMDAVLDITFDCMSEDESLSFSSSPGNYSTPKRSTASPNCSPALLALSEMRSLRSKVDLLNCEKQHLQEELELTKSQLNDLRNKFQQKEVELMRLNNHIACSNFDEDLNCASEQKSSDSGADLSKNSSTESSLVKMELEEFKDVVNKLRQDLESTIEDNNNLIQQLTEEKCRREESEQRSEELEAKNISLTSKVEELEILTASLRKTCEEQSLILAEKMNPADDESLRLSDCETLGGIIDIKNSELQEELRMQAEILEEKTKEMNNLVLAKEKAENTIQSLQREIEDLKSKYKLMISHKEMDCSGCTLLKDELSSLNSNFTSKTEECDKLKAELLQKTNEFEVLTKIKSRDEKKASDILLEKSEIINDYIIKMKDMKEELLTLQYDICEKDKALDFYKDETDFLNKCLSSKTLELNSMENDHSRINRSKDREISQLMKTVEHLSKEVKVLQEQLDGKRAKEAQGDWKLRLSQATANEEVARELIALHESLQWKSLKLGDLSFQVDQLKAELVDKETLNKELHERLLFLSERNREANKEIQTSIHTISHLHSKISSLELKERKLNQELVKKNQKFEVVDYELKELWKLLKQKFNTIDLEMDTCMLRGKPDLQDIIKFIDFMCEKLKENKKNINHLTFAINELEADNAEKTAEIESFENNIDKLASIHGPKAVEHWINENMFFQDRLKKIETDFENNAIKLQDTLVKLKEANGNLNKKDIIINDLESDVERLKQELKEKIQLVECLQQNINLYEHEKSVLKKKLADISQLSDKTCSSSVESGNVNKHESKSEGAELKSEGDMCSIEEKISQGFQGKLLDLQAKMKAQHDEDMKAVVDEYSKKIEQLKGKVKKDCVHIEQLSSELWETSDRLLLAQQEADALRSQLQRTQAVLREQSNKGTEDCNSFMWLGGMDAGHYVEEFVTTVSSKKKHHGQYQLPKDLEEEDEMFNQQCLEDLKAGICRLPSPIGRLSCPAESTRLDNDACGSEFIAPSGKPRKLKGSIMYRKPGPPTPSISAARHSLPGLELRRGLREHNCNPPARNRLSQFFTSITLSKSRTVQESPTPKTKRKGFFQRTFGNRENWPPKA